MKEEIDIKYGENVVEKVVNREDNFFVSMVPEPWEIVKDRIGAIPRKTIFVESMEKSVVDELEASIPPVSLALGMGGGSAIDFAKYVAWKRRIPLIIIPSIVSADAPVSKQIAVRINGRVRYIGEIIPKKILIDYSLIKKAPKGLNRAGVGDILSIHTALFDWKLSAKRGFGNYNEQIAKKAVNLVSLLEENVKEIRAVTNKGIKLLMQLFLDANQLCSSFGNAQPEEGSEHFFAYNLEYLTRKHFIHGELVCVGVMLMSHLQENNPERVVRIIKEAGVIIKLSDLGVSLEDISKSLLTLLDYVEKEGLPYSIVNEIKENKEKVNAAINFYLSNSELS